MKKFYALALAAVMLLCLFASCTNNDPPASSSPGASASASSSPGASASSSPGAPASESQPPPSQEPLDGPLFDKPITFEIWNPTPSIPFEEGMLLERALGERHNVFFDMTYLPGNDVAAKIELGLASKDLPDAYSFVSTDQASNWGFQGALVNYMEKLGQMPNFAAWLNEKRSGPDAGYVDVVMTPGNTLFLTPQISGLNMRNNTIWMYREDILNLHNLKAPATEVEMYEVCKALKAIYPDSYPLGVQLGIMMLPKIAWQWGVKYGMNGNWGHYYDNAQQKFFDVMDNPQFRDVIEWMAKMFSEELVNPTIISASAGDISGLMVQDKTFFWHAGIGWFERTVTDAREENPDFGLAYMKPFSAGPNGTRTSEPQGGFINFGYGVFTTGKQIDEFLKYLDWTYTEEGVELLSWGVEGESFYYDADGNKAWLGLERGDAIGPTREYGIQFYGLYNYIDPAAIMAIASDDALKIFEAFGKGDLGEPRIPNATLNEERQTRYEELNPPITNRRNEVIGMIITGQLPISAFDDLKAELEAMGSKEILTLVNDQIEEDRK